MLGLIEFTLQLLVAMFQIFSIALKINILRLKL